MGKKTIIYDARWQRQDGAQMRIEKVRATHGIYQIMYENGEVIQKTFSRRPYVLGQRCDGTIDTCVHALFITWCGVNNLDPEQLYQKAYPHDTYTNEYQREILAMAHVEGVCVPQKWSMENVEGMIESLTEINNHSLVNVIEEYI